MHNRPRTRNALSATIPRCFSVKPRLVVLTKDQQFTIRARSVTTSSTPTIEYGIMHTGEARKANLVKCHPAIVDHGFLRYYQGNEFLRPQDDRSLVIGNTVGSA